MASFFIFLPQNLTPFGRECPSRFQNHQIQHAPYLLSNSFSKGTQSQIQILYSVAYRVPLTVSGFSARSHSHYYLPVSIPKDTAVIHSVEVPRIQLSKLVFHGRISCRWEDGKATPLTAIFLLQLPTPSYSPCRESSILILGLHPRFSHHTLPHHHLHESVIEADNWVSLRREYQATSWSDHSERFLVARGSFPIFIHIH